MTVHIFGLLVLFFIRVSIFGRVSYDEKKSVCNCFALAGVIAGKFCCSLASHSAELSSSFVPAPSSHHNLDVVEDK